MCLTLVDCMTKVFVIVLVVVAVCVAALVAWYQPSLPPPAEAHRVFHPAGFSVVVPQGWEAHRLFKDARGNDVAALRSYPARSTGSQPEMTVTKLNTPPGTTGYVPIDDSAFDVASYQESPRGERWTLTLLAERDGQWYSAQVSVPEVDQTGQDVWMPYLKSLSVDPPGATGASAPSTDSIIPPPIIDDNGPSLIPRQ